MQIEATPVLLIIFNRPDKVRELIAALKKIKPTKIFISADGPRKERSQDEARCSEAREAIRAISWDCELNTNFFGTNLGCDEHVEKAISWFFEHVEQGIILEDDCIPHPDFFRFAHELLERYKYDQRVMMISGNNFQNGAKRGDASYYFSHYPNTWGWATWRRAWQLYDTNLTGLSQFVTNNCVAKIRPRKIEQRFWLRYFHSLYKGTRSAWDAKWLFAIWNAEGMAITPNVNLVQNVGFGQDATHTFSSDYRSNIETKGFDGQLLHPTTVEFCEPADQFLFNSLYTVTFHKRLHYLYNKIYGILAKHGNRIMNRK